MLSSAGVAPLLPGFHKLLSVTVTTFAVFFPPGCTFSVATTIACCPCHLVRVTSTFAVGRVAKFASDSCCSIYGVQLRTVVFLLNADDLASVQF